MVRSSCLFIVVVAPKRSQQSNTWSLFCRELQKQPRLEASQWFHCSSRKHPQCGRGSYRITTKRSNAQRHKNTPPQQLKPNGLEQGPLCQKISSKFFQMALAMRQHKVALRGLPSTKNHHSYLPPSRGPKDYRDIAGRTLHHLLWRRHFWNEKQGEKNPSTQSLKLRVTTSEK